MGIVLLSAQMGLSSDWLCLEFANTANWHASPQPVEELNSYGDLVKWAHGIGLLAAGDGQRLERLATAKPTVASHTLERAIALREALYHIFSALAHGRAAPREDLDVLNRELPIALTRLQVRDSGVGLTRFWPSAGDDLDAMLWPVVQSAVDLLTSEHLDRVKECADDRGCGFLFFDTTRNRSRRWCDMKICGNRAKAQRHYQRMRDESDDVSHVDGA